VCVKMTMQSQMASLCGDLVSNGGSMLNETVLATDESFVPSLVVVLEHLVKLSPPSGGQITRFHAIRPPEISIKDYLERIKRYFGCSNECFVLSLVYIDRIVKCHENFTVSILNVHRLLITSVMLAAKFFDDVYYSNCFYGRVGGVCTKEVNVLEAHFLSLLDFNLFVAPREYNQYRRNVMAAVCYRQAVQRVGDHAFTSPSGDGAPLPGHDVECQPSHVQSTNANPSPAFSVDNGVTNDNPVLVSTAKIDGMKNESVVVDDCYLCDASVAVPQTKVDAAEQLTDTDVTAKRLLHQLHESANRWRHFPTDSKSDRTHLQSSLDDIQHHQQVPIASQFSSDENRSILQPIFDPHGRTVCPEECVVPVVHSVYNTQRQICCVAPNGAYFVAPPVWPQSCPTLVSKYCGDTTPDVQRVSESLTRHSVWHQRSSNSTDVMLVPGSNPVHTGGVEPACPAETGFCMTDTRNHHRTGNARYGGDCESTGRPAYFTGMSEDVRAAESSRFNCYADEECVMQTGAVIPPCQYRNNWQSAEHPGSRSGELSQRSPVENRIAHSNRRGCVRCQKGAIASNFEPHCGCYASTLSLASTVASSGSSPDSALMHSNNSFGSRSFEDSCVVDGNVLQKGASLRTCVEI